MSKEAAVRGAGLHQRPVFSCHESISGTLATQAGGEGTGSAAHQWCNLGKLADLVKPVSSALNCRKQYLPLIVDLRIKRVMRVDVLK